jgi:hypothetical protein
MNHSPDGREERHDVTSMFYEMGEYLEGWTSHNDA